MTLTTPIEEFTFPISASETGAFIDSPPLWRRHKGPTQATSTSSASTSPSSSEQGERDQLNSSSKHTNVAHQTLQRKSFSSIEGGLIDHQRLIEMEESDRMDLLWEDFNEDLPRNRNSFMCNTSDDDDDEGGFSELGCLPTPLNLSKAVTGGAKNKKLRLVVFAKVFKRLFLLQRQSVKKRPLY